MSVCIIITEPQGAFCHRHHCFLTQVNSSPRYPLLERVLRGES